MSLVVACYGKIGSDLNALNSTTWIATAYVNLYIKTSRDNVINVFAQILHHAREFPAFIWQA